MATDYEKVKNYLMELGISPVSEDAKEEMVIITDESRGINQLVLDCESPILIMEQFIFESQSADAAMLKQLLQWNREVVHGAFVLDDTGTKVLYRDTLQLENLDLNELEGSIDALGLAMAEYSEKIIDFAKKS